MPQNASVTVPVNVPVRLTRCRPHRVYVTVSAAASALVKSVRGLGTARLQKNNGQFLHHYATSTWWHADNVRARKRDQTNGEIESIRKHM